MSLSDIGPESFKEKTTVQVDSVGFKNGVKEGREV